MTDASSRKFPLESTASPHSLRHAQGVWPVMLTPFTGSGEIDWSSLNRLVDWYIDAGISGLFAVCLSSEMYDLTDKERITLAKHVVDRAAVRNIPVVATGTFGGTVEVQAAMVRRIAETGVQGVVVITSQLALETESDSIWKRNAEELLEATGDISLGLYECPRPYKRLLSPELLKWAAQTGRFVFHKDTCCKVGAIYEKLEAVSGTEFRWFNANTPTLLTSLKAGATGYSGIGANVMPSLYVWLCRNFERHPEMAEKLQRFLSVAAMVVGCKYPSGSKYLLHSAEIIDSVHCRVGRPIFEEEELIMLRDLQISVCEWEEAVKAKT